MKKVKEFWQEFKKFISRGNVVDMAIGVIVASAFTQIVTALTNKIIMPCINWLLSLGGTNGLESAYTFLKRTYATDGSIDLEKSIFIDWGAFITAIINFFLIAFILFTLLKIYNNFVKVTKEFNEKVAKFSKKEIKKLKKQGLTNEEIEGLQKATQDLQNRAEVKSAASVETKPTTEQLLQEILVEIKSSKKIVSQNESISNESISSESISNESVSNESKND